MLLAIDTSTSLIGAAVHDDTQVLAEVVHEDARRHTELLAPAIDAALREAGTDRRDLTTIVVGVGPGPFTGLRVGIVTALVLGHALGLPVHGVCSLDALAAEAAAAPGAGDLGPDLLVATDARRREVYWARYAVSPAGAAHCTAGPQVTRPAELSDELRALPTAGRGRVLYPDLLHGIPTGAPGAPVLDVRPGVLAALACHALTDEGPANKGHPVVLLPPDPLYLRRPDAQARAAAPAGSPGAVPR